MLEVSQVKLNYGAAQALRGVSLRAETGQITCILGRNGVGKTSLVRAITGQHRLAGGNIIFDQTDISRVPSFGRARAGISLVPQGREIFPLLSVRENLETGLAASKSGHRNLPEFIFELFPALAEMLGRRGGDLSGGQQQQLAIARALVMRPRLIVLDEPTEGIQPSIIKDTGRAIRYLRDQTGLTILLVEQYLEFCRELADRVYIMERGEIVHSGPGASLDDASIREHLTV